MDNEHAETLFQYRWHIGSNGYARRNKGDVAILMHRVVMGLEPGDARIVDHISRDKLDNRRANLRLVTSAQNTQNRFGWERGTSEFRGVYWEPQRGRWRARAALDGVRHSLGRFATEIEAALAADEWRRENMPLSAPDPALMRAIREIEEGLDTTTAPLRQRGR